MLVCNQLIGTYIHIVYYFINFNNNNIVYKIIGIFLVLFSLMAYYFGYHDIF
jgi:hypothetical protein